MIQNIIRSADHPIYMMKFVVSNLFSRHDKTVFQKAFYSIKAIKTVYDPPIAKIMYFDNDIVIQTFSAPVRV